MTVSIIIPVYNAQETIESLVLEIQSVFEPTGLNYEIILVNDKSPDDSIQLIKVLCKSNDDVKLIDLSRNFGQHIAIAAGLESCTGDYAVVMDCDGQHDPKYIPQMVQKGGEGFHVVYSKDSSRKHGAMKNISARLYYKFLSVFSDYSIDPALSNFTLISRTVVDNYNSIQDKRKYFLMALDWMGFSQTTLQVENRIRAQGKSSYSVFKLFKHALEVTLSSSTRLLYISVFLGVAFSLVSFVGIAVVIYKYLTQGSLMGWTSTMAAIMLLGGLILTMIGIAGLYIGRIFQETKNRPVYIVQDKVNFND